jgi:hypothetical protein
MSASLERVGAAGQVIFSDVSDALLGHVRVAARSAECSTGRDRDLVHLAEAAGFGRIHLERHIDVEPGSSNRAVDLDPLLGSSPNPLAPTVGETIAGALPPAEQGRFVAHLAEAVARGDAVRRSAVAYLTATRRNQDGGP